MTDHRLIETYRNTDFIIDAPDGQLVLHVGEPNRQIDALLRDRGFSECAYITASNPQSVPLQSAENAHRHAALMERVRKLGYQFLSGRGVGTGDYWPPEEPIGYWHRTVSHDPVEAASKQVCVLGLDCSHSVARRRRYLL